MFDIANERLDLGLGVTVVQPIAQGLVDRLNAQDGLYTVLLRGKENGVVARQTRVVGCVRGGLNPYEDFDAFLAQARNPDLRFIVSNTTEAGIVYTGQDTPEDKPQASFPGKLTRLLYERWQAGLPGVIMLPVELIDDNGGELRECVFKTAEQWKLPAAFMAWLEQENVFASTLVDRIVTGYPRPEAQALCEELGYEDGLLDVAEPFALWVIEGPASIAKALPLDRAGLPVVFTDNVKPYKMRK
ncbi:MAG TPA: tagaturonate reductase, partial [Clostridia bacterium]|nr:tagaturonate reductase [Clostridia bacterium]